VTEEPTTAAPQATPSTVAPTTTVPRMTAEELGWLKAIPKVSRKIERSIEQVSNLTTSAMLKLANAYRSCTRELARGGSPSDRLQPVYALVKKACKEFDKGAACFTSAASVGIPIAGTPAERTQTRGIDCGFAQQGKGAVIMVDAMNEGEEIKYQVEVG
jgi:hypothetical protein